MPSVMLVDHHPLWIEALAGVLEDEGFDIAAIAESGADALVRARATRPDLIVMDLDIPTPDGAACTEALVAEDRDVRVVMLAASSRPEDVRRCVAAGAMGYLLKTARPGEILAGIQRALAGEAVFAAEVSAALLEDFRNPPAAPDPEPVDPVLTARERELLAWVARGLPYRQIAEELSVSHRTVQNHVHNMLAKTGTANRVELTLWGQRAGIISVGSGSENR
ncbi:response regulator [Parenemella sanctibonifatiensis]|uniref:DNA-binding response regulator n=1 Tax=Parenemella sanctibonifatiensis TaxID=2016505 RepID=A0A255EDL1_9ACTN|nr:response regulator transcription factor [Parenemella sanctibonifatiensis]OYN89648.1 DNA-binding response regulator [Parenemella sanctibonifatiensis]